MPGILIEQGLPPLIKKYPVSALRSPPGLLGIVKYMRCYILYHGYIPSGYPFLAIHKDRPAGSFQVKPPAQCKIGYEYQSSKHEHHISKHPAKYYM